MEESADERSNHLTQLGIVHGAATIQALRVTLSLRSLCTQRSLLGLPRFRPMAAMATTMRAVVQAGGPGEEESMAVADCVPVPTLGEGQVLIKVHRAALNRMDLLQRKGLYPVPPDASPILGVEVSGFVSGVGPGSGGRFKEGDRVMSLLQGGGYAEYAVANECTTMHAAGLSLDVAVSVPENLMTAHQLLFTVGKGAEGESVVLHAGGSGVGLAAIQMARRAGMKPFATCRCGATLSCILPRSGIGRRPLLLLTSLTQALRL